MAPRVAIIIYTTFGHVAKLAESAKSGIESAGGSATIYQVAETLPDAVLAKMHAPPKPEYPVLAPTDLANFDAFLFGVPTRFGSMPAQWKTFWDGSGQLWHQNALHRKYAGVFVSTGGLGAGQEQTIVSLLSTFAHHGILFVPLGYKPAPGQLANVEEAHGGSPWGAGTITGLDGKREPSQLELDMAFAQGKDFYETVSKPF
ncbi:flavodoxin-like fold protein [Ceratobasidium sp. 370]|nr:flavodoxin-like fold protein [Ceratobasidium sp. 370]